MKTVYAITKGEYSDYRVLAVCESKERAEEEADRYNAVCGTRYYEKADVEEMLFLDAGASAPEIWTLFICSMDLDGAVREWTRTLFELTGDQRPPSRPKVQWSNTYVWAEADSPEAARKAAADNLARMRAEKEGVA